MFSRTAEYALRAAAYLALHPGETTAEAIAAATGVPPRYLAKVLGSLTRAGVVRSQRGPGGGFGLARPPESITVSEIVESNEASRAEDVADIREPLPDSLGPETTFVTEWLQHIEGEVQTAMRTTTLAGLCHCNGH